MAIARGIASGIAGGIGYGISSQFSLALQLLAIDPSLKFFKDLRNTSSLTADYSAPYSVAANSGTIPIVYQQASVTTSANIAPGGTKEYMFDCRQSLIMKNGQIVGIDNLYIDTVPSSIKLKLWSENPLTSSFGSGTFTLVDTSEDFAGLLSGTSTNTITFNTPMPGVGTLNCFMSLLVTAASGNVFSTAAVPVHYAVTMSSISTIDGTFTADLTKYSNGQLVTVYSVGGNIPTGYNNTYEAQNQYLKKISGTSGQLYTTSGLVTPIIPSDTGSGTVTLAPQLYQSKIWINTGEATTGTQWRTKSSMDQVVVPFRPRSAPAPYLFVGDSIVAGYTTVTPTENGSVSNGANQTQDLNTVRFNYPIYSGTNQTFETAMETGLGVPVLNAGIGGDTSTSTLARWDTDVTPFSPSVVLYKISPNDITQGISQATTLFNIASMYAKAIAINAKFYVVAGGPWTGGTNTQLTALDSLNAAAQAQVATYPLGGWLTYSVAVGQERSGGSPTPPAGNLWDYQSIYNSDNVHMNALGNATAGSYLVNQILALNASGAPTGLMTATRGASNPATYIDSSGVMQVVTTSNVPRFTNGAWTGSATGGTLAAVKGLLIEPAQTQYQPANDGTGYTVPNGWLAGGTPSTPGLFGTNVVGPVTVTYPDVTTSLINITNAKAFRVQYTGQSGDVSATLRFWCPGSPVGSFAQNDVVTFGVWLKSDTGNTGFQPYITLIEATSGLSGLASQSYSLNGLITSSWKLFTFTHTCTNASTNRIVFYFGAVGGNAALGIDNGDTFDITMYGPSVVKNQNYLTSFIPNSGTTAITRNAEKLQYSTVGNRTAATETTFIKISPEIAASGLSSAAAIMDTDTKERLIQINTANTVSAYGNLTDSATSIATTTGVLAINTAKMVATAMQSTGDPNVQNYLGSSADGSTNNDYTSPAWGPYFYVGTKNDGSAGAPCIYQTIGPIYGSVLNSTKEALVVTIVG